MFMRKQMMKQFCWRGKGVSAFTTFRKCSTVSEELLSSFPEFLEETTLQDVLEKKEFKSRVILSMKEGTSILDAVKEMNHQKKDCCVIEHRTLPKRFIGIFTENDLSSCLVKGVDLHKTPIEKVMTERVISLAVNQTLRDMIAQMNTNRIRHIPLYRQNRGDDLDGDYEMMEIVHFQDILTEIVSFFQQSPDDGILSGEVGKILDNITKNSSENVDFFVESRSPIFNAVKLLESRDIPLVLIHEDFRMLGVFTMKNIIELIAKEKDIKKMTFDTIPEIPKTEIIPAETPIIKALSLMKENNMEALPVVPLYGDKIEYVDQYQKEIGLLKVHDVIRYVFEKLCQQSTHLFLDTCL